MGKKSEKQKNAIKKYYKFLQCARRVHLILYDEYDVTHGEGLKTVTLKKHLKEYKQLFCK